MPKGVWTPIFGPGLVAARPYTFSYSYDGQVEIGGELLSRLRARHLGKTDRELLERLASLDLALRAVAEVRANRT
jgi:hypothetical protein